MTADERDVMSYRVGDGRHPLAAELAEARARADSYRTTGDELAERVARVEQERDAAQAAADGLARCFDALAALLFGEPTDSHNDLHAIQPAVERLIAERDAALALAWDTGERLGRQWDYTRDIMGATNVATRDLHNDRDRLAAELATAREALSGRTMFDAAAVEREACAYMLDTEARRYDEKVRRSSINEIAQEHAANRDELQNLAARIRARGGAAPEEETT